MSTTPLAGRRCWICRRCSRGRCVQYLGDMGGDVAKVEDIGSGDETRQWPPFRRDAHGDSAGAVFPSANRNKRSIAIDWRQAAGREC